MLQCFDSSVYSFYLIFLDVQSKTTARTTTLTTSVTGRSKTKSLAPSTSSTRKTKQSSIKSNCCKTKINVPTKDPSSTISQKHTDKTSKTSRKADNSTASDTLYAVGIAFGTLALIVLVITAVLHFRRFDYIIFMKFKDSFKYVEGIKS